MDDKLREFPLDSTFDRIGMTVLGIIYVCGPIALAAFGEWGWGLAWAITCWPAVFFIGYSMAPAYGAVVELTDNGIALRKGQILKWELAWTDITSAVIEIGETSSFLVFRSSTGHKIGGISLKSLVGQRRSELLHEIQEHLSDHHIDQQSIQRWMKPTTKASRLGHAIMGVLFLASGSIGLWWSTGVVFRDSTIGATKPGLFNGAMIVCFVAVGLLIAALFEGYATIFDKFRKELLHKLAEDTSPQFLPLIHILQAGYSDRRRVFQYTVKAPAFNLTRFERLSWGGFALFALFWEGLSVSALSDPGTRPGKDAISPFAIRIVILMIQGIVLGCYLMVSASIKQTRKIYRHLGDSIVVEGNFAWVQRGEVLIPAILKQPAKVNGATKGSGDLTRLKMWLEVGGEECLYDPTSMVEIVCSTTMFSV